MLLVAAHFSMIRGTIYAKAISTIILKIDFTSTIRADIICAFNIFIVICFK